MINAVRIEHEAMLFIDTPVDVLRLACALSDGDVSLAEPTRFRSFRRAERRELMAALDRVIQTNSAKLCDVSACREQFKRLAERLHPHEYPLMQSAQDVFAVARGDKTARTLAGQVELALAAGERRKAIRLLSNAPGFLFRSLDRLLRDQQLKPDEFEHLVETLKTRSDQVSLRVLLSVREHFMNRDQREAARMFVNQRGRVWVTPDLRETLDVVELTRLALVLDEAIAGRMPAVECLVTDPAILDVALPLSLRTRPGGLGVLPRGSTTKLEHSHVRFFVYWKERERRTDFDLSTLLVRENFDLDGQVSWTNLRDFGVQHSGDITESANGATEFIDVDLDRINAPYLVPEINVYSGEGFDQVEECFFGFMARDAVQKGMPFEPRTVRMKSDILGSNRVSLPLIFMRDSTGDWYVRWMHLNLRGSSWGNRVEANQMSTALLAQAIVRHHYLTVGYLTSLLGDRAQHHLQWPSELSDQPVKFIGFEAPENLPKGSEVFTPANLQDLLKT
jgi:hypothetical protein